MADSVKFIQSINEGYTTKGDFIVLGAALLDGVPQKEAHKILNRNGLIAGAIGTGKTLTLQIIAENICAKGIPVLMMDWQKEKRKLVLMFFNHFLNQCINISYILYSKN